MATTSRRIAPCKSQGSTRSGGRFGPEKPRIIPSWRRPRHISAGGLAHSPRASRSTDRESRWRRHVGCSIIRPSAASITSRRWSTCRHRLSSGSISILRIGPQVLCGRISQPFRPMFRACVRCCRWGVRPRGSRCTFPQPADGRENLNRIKPSGASRSNSRRASVITISSTRTPCRRA